MQTINSKANALATEVNGNADAGKIKAMRMLGVPYPAGYEKEAGKDMLAQAAGISKNLKEAGIDCRPEAEIVALIAYLQRLGTDIKQLPKDPDPDAAMLH